MTSVKTKTEPNTEEWSITDEVTRLRIWGTDRPPFALPANESEGFVGVDETCLVRLTDSSGYCSKQHARIYRIDGDQRQWFLQNLSKNGTWVNESRHDDAFEIRAGMELRFGGVTVIAESQHLIRLRGFLARILGWGSDNAKTVDLALRRLYMAAIHRTPIVLCSESDPVALAYSLHCIAFGEQPFVVCNPRRKETAETVRWATNVSRASEALSAAVGGTMCVVAGRLPRDFDDVYHRLEDPGMRVQLVVCSTKVIDGKSYRTKPIIVPPVRTRSADLPLIVERYADDAVIELGARREHHFKPGDRDWIVAEESKSLSTIQTATLRLVALRKAGNVSRAAALLGMAAVSLKRWIGRRTLPMRLEPPG